jgi:Putative stress-responsive transcriptional regulator
MKPTITVNLNGIVFNIDNDAYALLDKYLKDIENHLAADESKDEIIADIEARIAELFSARMKSSKDSVKEVITVADVNAIIATMGNPSQFSDNEEKTQEQTSESKNEKKKTASHRLYRDPENSMFGGVLAGIAAYFNIDKTLVRIGYLVTTLLGAFVGFGWFMIIAYFVVWIIAPKAVTVAQRLEMRGEDVTIENIKSGFEDAKEFVNSEEFQSNAKSVGERIGQVFKVLIKVFGTIFGVIFGIVGFTIVAAIIITLIAVIAHPLNVDWNVAGMSFENGIMALVASLLVVGCPVFAIIYWVSRLLSQKRAKSNTPLWISLILWLAGIFMLISVGTNSFTTGFNEDRRFNWSIIPHSISFDNEEINSEIVTDTLQLSHFKDIELSGAIHATLIQDTINQIIITAPEHIRKRLNVKTENNKLRVYPSSGRWRSPHKVNVIVYAKDFHKINASGASKLVTQDTIRTQKIDLELVGASNANLKIIVDNIEAKMVGASDMVVAGSADFASLKLVGASEVNAENFYVNSLKINATGASSANVWVNESINAEAVGASTINVWGKPERKYVSRNGASKVNFK